MSMNRQHRSTRGPSRHPGLIIGGGVLLLLLLAALAYSHLGPMGRQNERIRREIQGLEHLARIRTVIEPLQVCRGLMTMHAAGRRPSPPFQELTQQQAMVEAAFADLMTYQYNQHDPLGLAAETEALHREWQQFGRERHEATAEELFEIFTPYIGRLLALHRRVVTASGLDLDPVAGTYNLTQILDQMLELVMEPTGQIRALYAGFLADPASGERMQERVMGRAIPLDNISARIEHHADLAIDARPELGPLLGELPATLRASTRQIRTLLQIYPLGAAVDPSDAQHFFAGATEVITAGYRLYDIALVSCQS